MSLRLKPELRIFVYSEYVDLRAGFDKLSMFVREKMNAEKVDKFSKEPTVRHITNKNGVGRMRALCSD